MSTRAGKNFGITGGQFLRYTLLPEFGKRLARLFAPGVSNLAMLMALVYNAVGILPKGHPFLRPAPNARFTILQVIGEAAQNIKFDFRNIDKIIVFFAILAGMVLFVLQFLVLIISIVTTPAIAGIPTAYTQFFVTPSPQTDLAYRMLFLVFGVDMFQQTLTPFPIHTALHALFRFYSIGILAVGIFIIIYFVITIIAETAETGVPFGKRYSHAWVPIRLILFFAMIVPLTEGINGAQWITLSVAKYGSSLATNGWIRFNNVVTSSYLGDRSTLIATPNSPELMHIPAFIMVAKTCQWAEGRAREKDVQAWLIHGGGAAGSTLIDGITYQQALTLLAPPANGPAGDIHIRFGEKSEQKYKDKPGFVYPDCGELVLKTQDVSEPGAAVVQSGYFEMVKDMWRDASPIDQFAENYTYRFMNVQPRDSTRPLPTAAFKASMAQSLESNVDTLILNAVNAQIAPANWAVDPLVLELGWAGAGIWYNKIAEQNGALTAAVKNTPAPYLYPSVMEFIREQKLKNDQNLLPEDRFTPSHSDGEKVEFETRSDEDIARVLNQVYKYWERESKRADGLATHGELTGNAFIDTINAIFGTSGLFDMCKNTDIHPLAQLSAVGKGLIDSAITKIAATVGVGLIGGTGLLQGHFGAAAMSAAGFLGTVAAIGLLVGFILFYVLPFMPFIYFFFAVGGWVKSIFEAMVGVPLWALAHLRIDGEGLPGQAAAGGYFLLVEIFLRPILIIFGLLAAIVIFAAQVKVLNEIFYLAASNISGTNPQNVGGCATGSLSGLTVAELGNLPMEELLRRGPIDEFFFTVIYAIIVYMMGTASFKLIDAIPNSILSRWLNAGVGGFHDDHSTSRGAEKVVGQLSVGASVVGSQLVQAVKSFPDSLKEMNSEIARKGTVEIEHITVIRERHNRDLLGATSKDYAKSLIGQMELELQQAGSIAAREEVLKRHLPEIERRLGSVQDGQKTVKGKIREIDERTAELQGQGAKMSKETAAKIAASQARTEEARQRLATLINKPS